MSYLFGSILTVPVSDLWVMLAVAIVNIGVVTYFYNDYLSMSYDEEFAQIRGVAVRRLYFLLIGLVAVSIVMIIQVVGLILVIALLTIPPFISEKYVRSLTAMMLYSSVLSIIFTVTGLYLAYRFNLTSGAAIILVAGAGFLISLLIERLTARRRSPAAASAG
jgi:zinc transport system permease protein